MLNFGGVLVTLEDVCKLWSFRLGQNDMGKPSRFGHLGEGWRGAKAGILCAPAALQCALGIRQACKRKALKNTETRVML